MLTDIITLIRPKQWTKNFFVLAPLFFGGEFLHVRIASRAILAAGLFCLISAAVYVFNDIRDRELDRRHPEKRGRPLASGRFPLVWAGILAGILGAAAVGGAAFLPGHFLELLLGYAGINLAYSLYLKHVAIVDVLCISCGFVLRVLAGGEATVVWVSHWLLLCTMTLALFLALGKRRHDLVLLEDQARDQRPALTGYTLPFLDHALSTASTLTLTCYVLYVADPRTSQVFGGRRPILTTVFVLYGLFRYFFLIRTRPDGGDPADVLLKDRPLAWACVGWGLTWALIIYLK